MQLVGLVQKQMSDSVVIGKGRSNWVDFPQKSFILSISFHCFRLYLLHFFLTPFKIYQTFIDFAGSIEDNFPIKCIRNAIKTKNMGSITVSNFIFKFFYCFATSNSAVFYILLWMTLTIKNNYLPDLSAIFHYTFETNLILA